MRCDLIIPALNEAANIGPLFDEIDPLRHRFIRHIIVADNGSTDATREIAEDRGAIVVCEPQIGYGAACLRALMWLDEQDDPPHVVAFLDADLSDDPSHLAELIAPIHNGHADLVIGSRVQYAQPGSLTVVQRFGNKLACSLISLFAGHQYSDLGPFRAVSWDALRRLRMTDRTWGWTVEMQMKAAMLELDIAEVHVPYRVRHSGRSKISGTVRGVVLAGGKILFTIIAIAAQRRRFLQTEQD